MYLQKRAKSKDRFPGRWDTSVGGHVALGETPEEAIHRETREELGIDLDGSGGIGRLEQLEPYIYSDETETEYVVPFRCVFKGAPRPNPKEVEDGVFFELEDIRRRVREQPDEFTPHFRLAFGRLPKAG
jgi:isopentenyldiphosphate isomerase